MALMQSRERGGCLTAWLMVAMLSNMLIAIYDVFSSSVFQQLYPTISPVIFLLLPALGLVNIISAIALWTWHKWGFYLYVASSLITFVINISMGLAILQSLIGLLG